MDKEEKFIFLQYAQSVCYFIASFFALIGLYFGIRKIFDQKELIHGVVQSIITFTIFIVLFIFAVKIIYAVKVYKRNVRELDK